VAFRQSMVLFKGGQESNGEKLFLLIFCIHNVPSIKIISTDKQAGLSSNYSFLIVHGSFTSSYRRSKNIPA